MFLENKYSKWYFNIITNAQKASRVKLPRKDPNFVYYEQHHIIPKSLAPETKDLKQHPTNGVLLLPREHFICHLLLIKMTEGDNRKKMSWALANMKLKKKGQEERYFNSKLYAMLKLKSGHTDESRAKMSARRKGKSTHWLKGKPAHNRGKPRSEETKQKIRDTKKKNYVKENNPRYGKPSPLKGRKLGPYSDERRKNISEALKGNTPWNKGLTKQDPRVKKNVENMASTRYNTT